MDHYGLEEILFFGPDEGTADVMEWACDYAKARGYPYWKSITTGKPPSLGGIPHDTYGMTTLSVHEYAKGVLEKSGVPESSVTKLQTGGPDGDLGSNEILISEDMVRETFWFMPYTLLFRYFTLYACSHQFSKQYLFTLIDNKYCRRIGRHS